MSAAWSPRARHMPVDGVVAGVALRADEPAPIDAGLAIEHLVGRLDPVDLARGLCPESLGIGLPAGIDLAIAALGRCHGVSLVAFDCMRSSRACCGSRHLSRGQAATFGERLSASAFVITDPLFYAAAVPAVILLGLSKGGFSGLGLLSLPLMALVVSPVQAAAIMLPILIVQDVVRLGLSAHLGPAQRASSCSRAPPSAS